VERPARRLFAREITVRRAAQAIAISTIIVTFAGGIAIWVLDNREFPTLGSGLWWAVQTVTTVGYGDHVPSTPEGQVVGTVIMVAGIGFLSVITATITAAFVESARHRRGVGRDEEILKRLERIEQRLDGSDRTRQP
jgi:voltage-gated potassium channel